jgi:hypothetical protein
MTDRERFEAYLAAVTHPRGADALPDLPPPTAGANGDGDYYFDWSYTYAKGQTLSITFPISGGFDWFYRDKDLKVVLGTEDDTDAALPEHAFALFRGFALAHAFDGARTIGAERDAAVAEAKRQEGLALEWRASFGALCEAVQAAGGPDALNRPPEAVAAWLARAGAALKAHDRDEPIGWEACWAEGGPGGTRCRLPKGHGDHLAELGPWPRGEP